ncbi:MAG: S8 family serine peptidase [Bacteroidota bacterium]
MIHLKRAGAALVFALFVSSFAFAQSPVQKAEIAKVYDLEKLENLEKRLLAQQVAAKDEVLQLARQNGWPIQYTFADGFGQAEIAKISPDGTPIYYQTYNADAAVSTRADHLNSGGSLGLNLDGQGMTAYVWDGGATRASHQEFDGPGGSNRVSQGDGATSLSDHATHVTGTMVASGFTPSAKGMASHAEARTFDWNSDLAEMASEASGGMLISNHSYGYGWRNQLGQVQLPAWYGGAYIAESRDLDQILYNAPYYMMFTSGGNDGTDNTANTDPLDGNSSYDKLSAYKCAKNNVVVAAANDANVNPDGTLNSYSITSFSSEGPTDDYRIKPDITGNGAGVYSSLSGSNSSYGSYNGTSMASPNVSGTAMLLQQHYNNVNGSFMRGATLKGLILHTAEDGGSNGPDAIYGWGLMNAKAAAEAISDEGSSALIQELTLNQGQSYQITVSAAGGPLFASICWTDPAGTANTGTANLTTPVLVNDLDIRVTQGGNTYMPWALTSITTNAKQDNTVDPYERVDINSASGTYTITVTHKGSLSSGSQAFSLVVTGLTPCTLAAPGNLTSSNITDNSFDLSWNAVSGANGYTVNINGSTTTVSGTSYSATGLIAGTPHSVSVSANCSGGGSGTPSTTNVTTTGVRPLDCNGTVSSFPYAEGFESGAGWAQASGDDGDWIQYSGSTPSSSTGPTAASEGTYYLYLEASTNGTPGQIGNNGTAILESPCFDLSGASAASFAFQYHMYGSNMGSMTLEATSDDLTWTNLWSLSGDQGNQWSSASVDLSAYAGGSVKLRMTGTTGASWQSDMAIDDFSLTTTGAGDTDPPTIPTGLASSNVTTSSFDLSWNASTDNIGVTGYSVYLDGTLDGTTAGTSYSFSGLNASTTYSVTVSASDAAGNTSAQSTALAVTTQSAGGGSTVISASYFETGWDDWNDGGADNNRASNATHAWEGTRTNRIRNGTTSSLTTSDPMDLSGYSSVEIDFYFRPVGMENGEYFELQYNDGTGFVTVASWTKNGTSINNNTFYNATEVLTSSSYNLASNGTFRFRNFANNRNDRIFLDAIIITGISTGGNAFSFVEEVAGGSLDIVEENQLQEIELHLYPNPVEDVLHFEIAQQMTAVRVFNLAGQLVISQNKPQEQLDVSRLPEGIYVLEVRTENGQKLRKKFVKQ